MRKHHWSSVSRAPGDSTVGPPVGHPVGLSVSPPGPSGYPPRRTRGGPLVLTKGSDKLSCCYCLLATFRHNFPNVLVPGSALPMLQLVLSFSPEITVMKVKGPAWSGNDDSFRMLWLWTARIHWMADLPRSISLIWGPWRAQPRLTQEKRKDSEQIIEGPHRGFSF